MITQKNIAELMDLISAAYGDKTFPENPERMAKVINLWAVMFKDDDPAEVALAVKDCISTLQFAPKIADIKSRIAQARLQGQMTELEAWAVVRKAVKSSKTANEANTAFLNLPGILQRIVAEPSTLMEWGRLSADTLEGVISSNFQRSYRELAKQQATYTSLPKDVQAARFWMASGPKEATLLPEPGPPKAVDEIQADMDADTERFRAALGIEAKPEYSAKVADFMQPLTDNEVKEFEARQKRADILRIERIKEKMRGNTR